jgi:Protein of unknown function (DUF1648)
MNHALYTARILVVALIAPLVLAAVIIVVGFSVAAHLPGRIPVHWDLSGQVNGYGSPYELPIAFVAVCVPLIALFGGIVVLWSHRGPLTILAKILAVTSLWVTLLVGATFVGALISPSAASHPAVLLVATVVIATAVAAAGWFVLPRGARGVAGSVRPVVAPLALTDGERASWIRTASASPAVFWTLVALGVLLTGVALFVTIATSGRYWAICFLPLVLILASLSTFAWTVRVDARGLLVRAALGIPVFRIPLDQISSANVIDIRAASEYGGWGLRIAMNQRIGIIMRSGEALEVHRTKGLSLVVTVDDASTAAGLLNGLIKRGATALP